MSQAVVSNQYLSATVRIGYLSSIWTNTSTVPPLTDVIPWAAANCASMFVLQVSRDIITIDLQRTTPILFRSFDTTS